ncbi:putative DCC family thiol-disulfide oxidoreductase YuxK [Pontibacter ummariensis]|uniref:Predicted thiol-disulfide oxidoreductase YuxK, DCC family n=1 Tax=Pontibacter ummariensis TaxID=1610492 RepID=A0A239HE22_9BACT|nr:DCC1-like thiol-disulfide oxidoreductase family protein [Pontibacter ummariensis]PRY10673.1 putative DCC family thiol-disulfide oxidoreductase YuxK [Pontibacter ummariensis]SNS78504.1 Predicted thiol-disulfide oxidoreductase YuxK, DCC family [Pontibacter ummariensis]
MPEKPILVYDGDCSFCKYWVRRWQRKTGDRVSYVPFQEVPEGFHEISELQFKRSVWLIMEDGRKLHSAAAAFELLAIGGFRAGRWLYYRVPFASKVFELAYRVVADNRDLFYKLTKLFFRDA